MYSEPISRSWRSKTSTRPSVTIARTSPEPQSIWPFVCGMAKHPKRQVFYGVAFDALAEMPAVKDRQDARPSEKVSCLLPSPVM